MPSLLRVLNQDRSDLEIINLALEALSEVICEQDQLGEQFTEIFIKDCANVGAVLDLIEEHDFNVRWSAIKLLSGLVLHQTKQMQNAVLSSPMAISRLMDLLVDSREVIRNDALLMLTQLTKGNANIQKIVAFESAFDRLLDIISSEGFADGGIVVEDSLTIMLNLLHNNISNLNYFKEGPYIGRLVEFFTQLSEISSDWSQSKVANVLAMYRVIRCLVSPNNPNNVTRSCQTSLQKTGLLSVLCETLMASGVPAHVLWETINTVAEVIRGCAENQIQFRAVKTPSPPQTPVVLLLLMSMLIEKQPMDLRCAILYCFQCYVHGNADIQNELIDQFDNGAETKLLHQGLSAKEPMSNWLAAMAVSYFVTERKILDPVLFEVTVSLKNPNAANQARIGYLILITTWLCGSETNVAKFVNASDNISYLTSELCLPSNEQQEAIVQSLCATTLALCIVFNDDIVDAFNRTAIRTLIVNRVGKDSFLEKLSMLSKQPCYTAALRSPQIVSEQTLLDHNFCSMYRGVENMLHKCLDENDVQEKQIEDLKKVIRQQEQLIAELRESRGSALPHAVAATASSTAAGGGIQPSTHIPMLPTGTQQSSGSFPISTASGPPVQMVAPVFEKNYYEQYQYSKQRVVELEAELQAKTAELQTKTTQLEDLLDLMMDQEAKIKRYEDQLRALGRSIDYPIDGGDAQPEQNLQESALHDVCNQVQNVFLNDTAEGTLVPHPVVSMATSISHSLSGVFGGGSGGGGTSDASAQPLLTTSSGQPMLPLQQSLRESSVQGALLTSIGQTTLVTPAPPPVSVIASAVLPESPAVQAITSVVPAPIAQTATVSDVGVPQPLLMTTVSVGVEQPTAAAAAPQFVQFYNPASMFQPVMAEASAAPSADQPPRPPSSTVSSSAAELTGTSGRADPESSELNDGFEMVPTPTAEQQQQPAAPQPVQGVVQGAPGGSTIPVVYPFQQTASIVSTLSSLPPYSAPPITVGVPMFVQQHQATTTPPAAVTASIHDHQQQQQQQQQHHAMPMQPGVSQPQQPSYLESFVPMPTSATSGQSHIPTQFVPPMVTSHMGAVPLAPTTSQVRLSSQHQQQSPITNVTVYHQQHPHASASSENGTTAPISTPLPPARHLFEAAATGTSSSLAQLQPAAAVGDVPVSHIASSLL
ncbi:general vesicular transport factor p115-like [Varroa destructor]|uniref:General vesicular transport factor p115 n=1 Tax=Varroa destructor TaxID=109461 RepID=A0A7M7MJT1_VARDE|nr:general vesicular transport factor p115-like [Varroa destructor]